MSSAKRFSVLRDPVHGDVFLTHEELSVLDTPEMQRLRGIKQLGTAFLVYPGAVHTRFDHSIGVLHMTQKMIEAINRNFELQPRDTLGISEREARVLRIAALVHDVTHIPFGHHIEEQAECPGGATRILAGSRRRTFWYRGSLSRTGCDEE